MTQARPRLVVDLLERDDGAWIDEKECNLCSSGIFVRSGHWASGALPIAQGTLGKLASLASVVNRPSRADSAARVARFANKLEELLRESS